MKTFSVTVTLTDAEALDVRKGALLYRLNLEDFLVMALKTGVDYSNHLIWTAIQSDLKNTEGFYEDEDDDTV